MGCYYTLKYLLLNFIKKKPVKTQVPGKQQKILKPS